MRPLSLHISALNDDEYDLYTTSFNDLAELPHSPAHGPRNAIQKSTRYEDIRVGVREARAWLRGRYSHLSASDIDMILKLFCPNMLSSDSLSGDQFFAALRLVLHVQDGKPLDRNLAFVQAYPNPSKPVKPSSPPSPPKPQLPLRAPPPPTRAPPPPFHPTHPDTNPFARKSMDKLQSPPPAPDSFPPPIPAVPPKINHNPFLKQDKAAPTNGDSASQHPPVIPPLPPRKPAMPLPPRRTTTSPVISSIAVPSSASIKEKGFPPTVPLKPSHMTSPLMMHSLEASRHAQNVKRAEELLHSERVMQVIRTSGSPAPGAPTRTSRSASPGKPPPPPPPPGTKGKGTAELGQKRGSSISASDGTSGSSSVVKKPLVQKRVAKSKPRVNPHPTFSDTSSSSSGSEDSFYEVAGATLTYSLSNPTSPTPTPTPASDPFRPPLPSRDSMPASATSIATSFAAPPTHPDRRASDSVDTAPSPTTRVFRSRSLHSPSGSTPPVPPPRKRPESAQINSSTTAGALHKPSLASLGHAHARTASFQGVSRHLSLTSPARPSATAGPTAGGGDFGDGISGIQRTLAQLQMRAQPRLDAARYKAEAGLSRRGFVGGGGARGTHGDEGTQGLMGDDRDRDRGRIAHGHGHGRALTSPSASGLVAGDDAADVDMGGPASISITDSDSELDGEGDDDHRGRRARLYERDNLKWPAGEGWKPLS